MKTVRKTKPFHAPPQVVFDKIDDLGTTGMHMSSSSMPLMGGKMNFEFLTRHKRGLNTRYRWTGKVMWMLLDFTVEVTNWVAGKEKSWETVGPAKLIIYSWFQMNLKVFPRRNSCRATLSITYKKPDGILPRILCYFLGKWYAKWCLNNMLNDTAKAISAAKQPVPG